MRTLLGLAFLFLVASACLSEEGSPGEAQNKPNASQNNQQTSPAAPSPSPPPTITFAPVINVSTAKHAGEPSYCPAPKGWKEWGTFAWCRSWEWLDPEKVIAIFTVILGAATGLLWLSTRGLVKEARRTGERQLRGYLSVTPTVVATASNQERFVQIIAKVKNHGQTPITQINSVFGVEFFANPLPDGFEYPAPTQPINLEATLFPQMDMDYWFNFDLALDAAEFQALENNQVRLHLWGQTFYTTAFGERCYTEFKASVGGPDFVANLRATRRNQTAAPYKWWWEQGHGFGT